MRNCIKILTLMIISSLLATGCDQMTVDFKKPPKHQHSEPDNVYRDGSYMAKETVDGSTEHKPRGATDVALEWADKYARLLKKFEVVQSQNLELERENRELQQKSQADAEKLQAAEKELSDANEMLEEMKGELKKWRANVLGFRDEMRTAQTAQLAAMKRILVLLGADTRAAEKPAAPSKGDEK